MRRFEPSPSSVLSLWDKLRKWNKTLGQDAIAELYDPRKTYYLLDDVGVLWTTAGSEVLAHFVFWDGRLRGREELVRFLAQMEMRRLGVSKLVTHLPKTLKMNLLFLERVGFKIEEERDGMLKVYLARD